MTQTLPKFPHIRLARLRLMPFWAQALALCALFAIVGVGALDDYGAHWDETDQRQTAAAVADYAMGVSEEPPSGHDRYYGIAFEMPLLLLERALGLQDSRHIYLTRHLVTHLFFIVGGFVCGMLAYRMLGSGWAALFAMLLFMSHPRLYAHSFFNSKDIPFAVMTLIALCLTHRAFRKDTLAAFLLCGIVVGLAINLRVFGLTLLPLILAMRAPDLRQAGREERRRILASAGVFTGAALATAYIIHPYYWENSLRFFEGIRSLSQHPTILDNLFMGEIYRSDAVPWNYIPVWFAITAPPVALLLGAIGCAAACWQAIAHPIRSLHDREIRFRVLLLGCVALPVAVVIILQANIYQGWRHMYFLWGPFSLLAAVGLHRIASGGSGLGKWNRAARIPGWIRGGGLRRTLAYSAAGVGLITTLTAMAALHPHQQMYFNALVDTKTPGAPGNRYDMDYWELTQRQSLEYLLARYPEGDLRVWPRIRTAQILPQKYRNRFVPLGNNPRAADFYLLHSESEDKLPAEITQEASFYLHPRVNLQDIPNQPPLRAIQVYGSVIVSIVAKDVGAYGAVYDDVAVNGAPLARSAFDVYAYDGALYYLKSSCDPPPTNADFHIFLHVIPGDAADMPAEARARGFENRDFLFNMNAAFFDGKCVNRQPLPDYPIARIRTGQNAARGVEEWRADIDLAARAAAQAVYDNIAAGDYGLPVAQSDFDVYLRGDALAYLKEPCAAGDTDARFFLHIFPADSADLPTDSRERGFANLDFQFADRGAYAGDKCVATRTLPTYPIELIRTGQFVSGEGRVWDVEFSTAK